MMRPLSCCFVCEDATGNMWTATAKPQMRCSHFAFQRYLTVCIGAWRRPREAGTFMGRLVIYGDLAMAYVRTLAITKTP